MFINISGRANSGCTTKALNLFDPDERKIVFSIDGDIAKKLLASYKGKTAESECLKKCAVINSHVSEYMMKMILATLEYCDFDLFMIDCFNSMFITMEERSIILNEIKKKSLEYPTKTFIIVEHETVKLKLDPTS